MQDFLSKNHVVPIWTYSQDVYAQTMDAISLENYGKVTFFLCNGSTAADTSTVTVCADTGSDVSGGTAMAFKYRTLTAGANPATSDTWSDLTAATTAGIALTATTYKCWAIEVTAEQVAAALDGGKFVYLAFADAGGATFGCIFAVLSEPRYPGAVPVTAIA